jgi:flagellar hook-associated protein 1 FlgK
VDDPAALPLSNHVTSDPGDIVLGVDFSGGMASVVTQLNNLLGSTSLQFSNPAGNTLRIMDDGGANKVDINAASANITVTSLTSGGPEFPFFVDGTVPYTGAISSLGRQSVGLAGRIAVNPALLADPSRLVIFDTSPLTPSADATRPSFVYRQLTSTALDFSPSAGVGTTTAPFSGSLPSYIRQMISQQGDAAQNAASLKSGQELVVNALQQRVNDESGVNVDAEMAKLLSLQNAYAANARVMTTVKDLFDLLMNM